MPLTPSHNQILMQIEDEKERLFYETEAIRQEWTLQQLQRYYGDGLYERYAVSCDKDALMNLSAGRK